MTVDELYAKYNEDVIRASKEWQDYSNSIQGQKDGYKSFKGFRVDYGYFERELINALKEEFKLTQIQVMYIWGKAWDDYHAYFSDIFYGSRELAQFVVNFPKV